METGHQFIQHQRREERASNVKLEFFFLSDDFCYYRVLSNDNKIKYTGRIEKTKSLTEGCSCPDQFHKNNRFYKDEHGFALQCKHIIQAKKKRGWYN